MKYRLSSEEHGYFDIWPISLGLQRWLQRVRRKDLGLLGRSCGSLGGGELFGRGCSGRGWKCRMGWVEGCCVEHHDCVSECIVLQKVRCAVKMVWMIALGDGCSIT